MKQASGASAGGVQSAMQADISDGNPIKALGASLSGAAKGALGGMAGNAVTGAASTAFGASAGGMLGSLATAALSGNVANAASGLASGAMGNVVGSAVGGLGGAGAVHRLASGRGAGARARRSVF